MTFAIIGAIVAVCGLAVGVTTFFRNVRTAVQVEIHQRADRLPMMVLDEDPRPEPLYHALEVVVINRGTSPEAVSFVAVEQLGSGPVRKGHDVTDLLPNGADSEVAPRKRITARVAVSDLGFDPNDGFVAVVRLATGKTAKSKPDFPDVDLVAHIAEHNRGAKVY